MALSNQLSNEDIRHEMSQIQRELKEALSEIKKDVWNKIKPEDRNDIETEFNELDELLERLKSGKVWIALFGKASVGKSAIANSIIGSDVAEVGVCYDTTITSAAYEKDAWKVVDVPGIMSDKVNENLAVSEAKKAHGHIFVIEGEPLRTEMELFEKVDNASPHSPKIVFVNKWDKTRDMPSRDIELVKDRITEKMEKFVKSPDKDIIYGSALIFDREKDEMIRQKLPDLEDQMYDNAGTFGQVMGIIDPAKRATSLNNSIKQRIFEIRSQASRKVIAAFSLASAFSSAVPFGEILGTPTLWVSMAFIIFKIMGKKQNRGSTEKVVWELTKACAQTLGVIFAGTTIAAVLIDIATTAATPFWGVGAGAGLLADIAALGYYKYRRTAILGEVIIDYIRHDCSWGNEEKAVVIERCKNRAMEYYNYLKKKSK